MPHSAPITVVIPAYNSEQFIGEALRSILGQTLAVAEVIVVDDGSTDRTAAVAQSFGVRVLRQTNAGPSAARNAGIRAATQPWIALLDADDVWLPEKISWQWKAIQLHPQIGMVACDYRREENGQVMMPSRLGELRERYTNLNKIKVNSKISYFARSVREFTLADLSLTPSAMLLRRELLIAVGLFDENLRYWEDNECFLRMLAHCALAFVEEPMMSRRLHGSNATHDSLNYQLGRLKVAELLTTHPARYPPRASQVYEQRLQPFLVPTGRLLLKAERSNEARALFARQLKSKIELRALTWWAATWIKPHRLKRLTSLKRLIEQQVFN